MEVGEGYRGVNGLNVALVLVQKQTSVQVCFECWNKTIKA